MLKRGFIIPKIVKLMLREIADDEAVAVANFTGERLERADERFNEG